MSDGSIASADDLDRPLVRPVTRRAPRPASASAGSRRLSRADHSPAAPGDLRDDDGNGEADQRVGAIEADRGERGAGDPLNSGIAAPVESRHPEWFEDARTWRARLSKRPRAAASALGLP
jgi:hypothetical protein